ncbi:MAG TPA: hypothetical protein VGA19_08920, partial [Rhodospirillales bacterium]
MTSPPKHEGEVKQCRPLAGRALGLIFVGNDMNPGGFAMVRRPLALLFAAVLILPFAALRPAAAEEVKFAMGGLTLNAIVTLAPGKTLKDGVVLITHGTMAHNDMQIIRSLRNLLGGRGLNTLAINLSLSENDRHGIYDCAKPHRHKDSDGPAEIALWVDWLKKQG